MRKQKRPNPGLPKQVRVRGDRGFLTGRTGLVEEEIKTGAGGNWYGVRFPPPYHDTLYWFRIGEISRTTHTPL